MWYNFLKEVLHLEFNRLYFKLKYCMLYHRVTLTGSEEEGGPRKAQQPSGSSPSLNKQKYASTSAKKGQENPKEQSEGQEKGKATGKIQVEQALPTESQNPQEGEDSHEQCVQYGKNSDAVKKQGGEKLEPINSKEVDLLKLVAHSETCNEEI
ncbi:hypothetical protein O181_049097 [Austropuccinia psidii MF-1]|uniref:Uncharacterized protein n=1 Tax=Austropuccinia psidii MF-1 TaxID=1389203 RepID=A0A9Q3HMA3_9BASI|nr:hypothetical protein [Austropuccinia psidii MF-1]